MNRLKRIKQLKDLAFSSKLENREIIRKYPMNRLCILYNGIGPDFFPEKLRNILSAIHPELEAAALIHDLEWHESDGSEKHFSESNRRFRSNGFRIARYLYNWYDPRRWIVMNQARRLANFCSFFGHAVWNKNFYGPAH